MNTPSKLRPPKPRKSITDEVSQSIKQDKSSDPNTENERLPNKQSRIDYSVKTTLPNAIGTKTFRTGTSSSRKPLPVTKPIQRSVPKTSASGKTFIRGYSNENMVQTRHKEWEQEDRLKEMEKMMLDLKTKMSSSSQTTIDAESKITEIQQKNRELEDDKKHLQSMLSTKERENEELQEDIRKMKRQLNTVSEESEEQMNNFKIKNESEISKLKAEAVGLENELKNCQRNLDESYAEIQSLKSIVSSHSTTIMESEASAASLKVKLQASEEICSTQNQEIQKLTKELTSTLADLEQARDKLQEGERLRRKLHNTVQELKGNIRVFCRVRPLLESESKSITDTSHIVFGEAREDEAEIKFIQNNDSTSSVGSAGPKEYPFSFDKVFGFGASQHDVFEEISQLVQSALDGYRVCIFAYGQTGSGKTFTMEGNQNDAETCGMIPRAVDQIFQSTFLLAEKGWKFSFEATYVEIYNETIRDLLSKSSKDNDKVKHDIKHADGNTTVTGINAMEIQESQEILNLLKMASLNRSVAETQCNEHSSRSHSVFTLKIVGENHITSEKINGLLNLIDLAGSERLSQSGSTGDRLKETQAINKSLSSLGDVIHAISNKDSHVPYRNSKLTYLLQNSLGGNCKTLMFVNISPVPSNFNESLCSLRFATKVNACHIGTATRKINK